MTDPDTALTSFASYIRYCVSMVGTNTALAEIVGFSSGSRIGDWLSGQDGRPSALASMKLAEFSGHDLLAVLRLCGHEEMADIIERHTLPRRGLPEANRRRLREGLEQVEALVAEAKALQDKL